MIHPPNRRRLEKRNSFSTGCLCGTLRMEQLVTDIMRKKHSASILERVTCGNKRDRTAAWLRRDSGASLFHSQPCGCHICPWHGVFDRIPKLVIFGGITLHLRLARIQVLSTFSSPRRDALCKIPFLPRAEALKRSTCSTFNVQS